MPIKSFLKKAVSCLSVAAITATVFVGTSLPSLSVSAAQTFKFSNGQTVTVENSKVYADYNKHYTMKDPTVDQQCPNMVYNYYYYYNTNDAELVKFINRYKSILTAGDNYFLNWMLDEKKFAEIGSGVIYNRNPGKNYGYGIAYYTQGTTDQYYNTYCLLSTRFLLFKFGNDEDGLDDAQLHSQYRTNGFVDVIEEFKNSKASKTLANAYLATSKDYPVIVANVPDDNKLDYFTHYRAVYHNKAQYKNSIQFSGSFPYILAKGALNLAMGKTVAAVAGAFEFVPAHQEEVSKAQITDVPLSQKCQYLPCYADNNYRFYPGDDIKLQTCLRVDNSASAKSATNRKLYYTYQFAAVFPENTNRWGKTTPINIAIKNVQFQYRAEPGVVKLNKNSLTLGREESYQLTSSIALTNSTDKAVEWFAYDADDKTQTRSTVVTVNKQTGVVKAIKNGKAVVCAKYKKNGYIAKCSVTVNNPAAAIYFENLNSSEHPNAVNTTLTMGKDETLRLWTHITNGSSQKREFRSSNSNVCTVDQSGNIKAKGIGTANITVTTYNGRVATCKVTVKKANPTQIKLNRTSITMGEGEGTALNVTYIASDTASFTSFTSSNSNVCEIRDRKIVAKKVGTATITVKTLNGKTATCKVTVKPAVQKITLNKTELTLNKGKTFKLVETHSPNGSASVQIKFSSSNTNICTVDSTGLVTAKNKGTATITVSSFNGKTAKCKVTVK